MASMAPMAPMAPAPFNLGKASQMAMAMNDEDFIPNTWADLKFAIEARDLSILPRTPSMIRGYIAWSRKIIAEYGSLERFLLQERLCWKSSEEASQTPRSRLQSKSSIPFADKSDYRILYNDWPYGFTSDITHLVVWLKTPLPIYKECGEMTPEASALVKRFVEKTFVRRMKEEGAGTDCVLYFKNIPKLQSVGALEHFHVLLRRAKGKLLDEWTEGDAPMYKLLQDYL